MTLYLGQNALQRIIRACNGALPFLEDDATAHRETSEIIEVLKEELAASIAATTAATNRRYAVTLAETIFYKVEVDGTDYDDAETNAKDEIAKAAKPDQYVHSTEWETVDVIAVES